MKPGPLNLITDVPGISVGQAADTDLKSGVTVIVGDEPMITGVHVAGGAPGTRETDLLRPDATVQAVDALVLSGGSAFGLAAADGVASGLRNDGRGFVAAGHNIPIVPTAILFDLANGGQKNWNANPYVSLGSEAYLARDTRFLLGTHGAGLGATTATLKGGLGSASAVMESGATVGAIVAVNALGQANVGETESFWAAPWEEANEFGGHGINDQKAGPIRTKLDSGGNTTIAIVATDGRIDKSQATRMAIAAHDGIARALVPAHTPLDGDLVFAASSGQKNLPKDEQMLLGHVAATCLARAIARGVYNASSAAGDPLPTWNEKFG